MNWRRWFAQRGPRYVFDRASVLLDRYGLTPDRAAQRAMACVSALAEHGCAPTFPVPGSVVDRRPAIIQQLQAAGAEIAVHSYDHVDLRALPPEQAARQLTRAAEAFKRHRIAVHGFRCPYLGCNDDLLAALPPGLFGYSSNRAIRWEVLPEADPGTAAQVYEVLGGFYRPLAAGDWASTPWWRGGLVEIPACVPDDLQIYDGLRLGAEGLIRAWGRILTETSARGELFVLLFHPELASEARDPLIELLDRAARLRPSVWLATLSEVSAWWREKAGFRVELAETDDGLRFSFDCSPRATVLARGLSGGFPAEPWDGTHLRVRGTSLTAPRMPRPLVGVASDAPTSTAAFLRDQGYILDTGPGAERCGIFLDAALLRGLPTQRALIDFIEAAGAPLVRFGRWPDGAKSAMCVTGDLDALTLLDYLSRLLV